MSHVITQLLSSPFLLHETNAEQTGGFIYQLLQQLTQQQATAAADRGQSLDTAQKRATLTAQLAVRGSSQRVAYALGDTLNLTGDGVAIVNLQGTIFRYGFWSYFGTEDYVALLQQLLEAPSIRGVVVVTDSGGGQASGIDDLYDVIAQAAKPVIALVTGTAASAAYYAIAGATEIWATQKSSVVGSIGAFVTLLDLSAAYAQAGVKFIEIYARESTQKNREGREAKNGNVGPMQDMLSGLIGFFHQSVRDGRGDRLVSTEGLPTEDNYFEGGVFWAEKAQSLGLIDRIGTLQQAVDRVYELAAGGYTNPRSGANLTDQTSTTDMAFLDKQPLITALRNIKAEEITPAQLEAINTSLSEQGINCTLISDTEAARLNGLETANATLTTENTRLSGEVTRLGKQAGAAPSAPVVAGQEASPQADNQEQGEPSFYSETDAKIDQLRKTLKGGK